MADKEQRMLSLRKIELLLCALPKLVRVVRRFEIRAVGHNRNIAVIAVAAQRLRRALGAGPDRVAGIIEGHDPLGHQIGRQRAVRVLIGIRPVLGMKSRNNGNIQTMRQKRGLNAGIEGTVRMEDVAVFAFQRPEDVRIQRSSQRILDLGERNRDLAEHVIAKLRIVVILLPFRADDAGIGALVHIQRIVVHRLNDAVDDREISVDKHRGTDLFWFQHSNYDLSIIDLENKCYSLLSSPEVGRSSSGEQRWTP